jgi:hypothetical protein
MTDTILIGLSTVTIIAMFIIYYAQRKRKSLYYDIMSTTPLLNLSETKVDNIAILYKNERVDNVYLSLVKFSNTGNVPIATREFEIPLELDFGHGSIVLSAELYKSDPSNLKFSIEIDSNFVKIQPVLINPKDYFIIKTLVADYAPETKIKVNGRIYGIRKIKLYRFPVKMERMLYIFTSLLFFSYILISGWGIFIGNGNSISSKGLTLTLLMSLVLLVFSIFRVYRSTDYYKYKHL